jgi:hypothetical protein
MCIRSNEFIENLQADSRDISRPGVNLRGQQDPVLRESSIESLMLTSQRISIEFKPDIEMLSSRQFFERCVKSQPHRLFSDEMNPALIPPTGRSIVWLHQNLITCSSFKSVYDNGALLSVVLTDQNAGAIFCEAGDVEASESQTVQKKGGPRKKVLTGKYLCAFAISHQKCRTFPNRV